MRRAGFIVAFAALLMAAPVTAQDFNASEPSGPRTGQNDAKAERDRLETIIRELEGEIARLREGSALWRKTRRRRTTFLAPGSAASPAVLPRERTKPS